MNELTISVRGAWQGEAMDPETALRLAQEAGDLREFDRVTLQLIGQVPDPANELYRIIASTAAEQGRPPLLAAVLPPEGNFFSWAEELASLGYKLSLTGDFRSLPELRRAADLLRSLGIGPEIRLDPGDYRGADGKEVYSQLLSCRPERLFFVPGGDPEAFGAFFFRVLEQWLPMWSRGEGPEVMNITDFRRRGALLPACDCAMGPYCQTQLALDRDGMAYNCVRTAEPGRQLGHFPAMSLRSILTSFARVGFLMNDCAVTKECRACTLLPICGGGCPAERQEGRSRYCREATLFITRFYRPLSWGTRLREMALGGSDTLAGCEYC